MAPRFKKNFGSGAIRATLKPTRPQPRLPQRTACSSPPVEIPTAIVLGIYGDVAPFNQGEPLPISPLRQASSLVDAKLSVDPFVTAVALRSPGWLRVSTKMGSLHPVEYLVQIIEQLDDRPLTCTAVFAGLEVSSKQQQPALADVMAMYHASLVIGLRGEAELLAKLRTTVTDSLFSQCTRSPWMLGRLHDLFIDLDFDLVQYEVERYIEQRIWSGQDITTELWQDSSIYRYMVVLVEERRQEAIERLDWEACEGMFRNQYEGV